MRFLPTLESIAVLAREVERARHENYIDIESQPTSYRYKLKKPQRVSSCI